MEVEIDVAHAPLLFLAGRMCSGIAGPFVYVQHHGVALVAASVPARERSARSQVQARDARNSFLRLSANT